MPEPQGPGRDVGLTGTAPLTCTTSCVRREPSSGRRSCASTRYGWTRPFKDGEPSGQRAAALQAVQGGFDSRTVHRMRNLLHDLRCGWHSGIRPCCILWYSVVCRHVLYGRWWTYRPYWRAIEISEYLHGKVYDHVPCPACLVQGQVVEVQDCDCSRPLGEMANAADLSPVVPCGRPGSSPGGATK